MTQLIMLLEFIMTMVFLGLNWEIIHKYPINIYNLFCYYIQFQFLMFDADSGRQTATFVIF